MKYCQVIKNGVDGIYPNPVIPMKNFHNIIMTFKCLGLFFNFVKSAIAKIAQKTS